MKIAVWQTGLLVSVLCVSLPMPVWAHGGEEHSHDHEPAPLTLPASDGQRFVLQSPDTELVGVVEGQRLTVYLDRFASNAPLANARVELASGTHTVQLQTDANGVAQGEAGWLAAGGTYTLTVTVLAQGMNDLFSGQIRLAAQAKPEMPAAAKPWWQFWLENTLLPRAVYAHGGEDHSHDEPAVLPAPAGAAAQRLADGSVFVPKAVQRLWGLRTVSSRPQPVAHSLTLHGVVVADPNASALVQPTQSGRLLAPQGGFLGIGSPVSRGQVLAVLEPAASNVDQADQQEKRAALRSELALAEKTAQRLNGLRGVVAQSEVDAANNQVATLQARLAALQAIPPNKSMTLTAPIDGILSSANVSVGQQASAGDTLFAILDPRRLQVEALAYEPTLVTQLSGATMPVAGQVVPLRFIGASHTLRQQALPLRFAIDAEVALTGLVVGQAVQLQVQTRSAQQAVPLPVRSLVYDNNQQPTVWVKTAAEQFKPYPVRFQPLDAEQIAVLDGLPAGNVRVVSDALALLTQVR